MTVELVTFVILIAYSSLVDKGMVSFSFWNVLPSSLEMENAPQSSHCNVTDAVLQRSTVERKTGSSCDCVHVQHGSVFKSSLHQLARRQCSLNSESLDIDKHPNMYQQNTRHWFDNIGIPTHHCIRLTT